MTSTHPAPDEASDAALVVAFLERVADDRAAGTLRELSFYQAQFAGHERTLAAAWQRLLAPLEAELPVRLGPYQLRDELGRGAQARVFRAFDVVLRREVALKLVPSGPLHAHAVARLRREWTALSRVDHPAVCPIHAVGEDHGRAWIAMRLVAGSTLATLLERVRDGRTPELPWRDAVRLVERAARGVHAAHAVGVVHRDLKPSNIMVEPSGAPVVVDFGLARDQHGDVDLTAPGDLLGTPAYMAPEQVEGTAVDARADVHALGVVLFEMLTLTRAFDAPTRALVYDGVRRTPLQLDQPRLRATSRDLRAVLGKATEKSAARRYRDMLAFADDLRRAAAGEPVHARPIGALGKLRRWAARNPLVATLSAGVVLATLAAFAALLAATVGARRAAVAANALALAAQAQRDAARAPARALHDALDAHAAAPSAIAAEALAAALAELRMVRRRRLLDGDVRAAAFTQDGAEMLCVDGAGRLLVADTATVAAPRHIADVGPVHTLALDPAQEHALLAQPGAVLRVRRADGAVTRSAAPEALAAVAVDPAGEVVAVSDPRGAVWTIDAARGVRLHALDAGAPVRDLAVHARGAWVVARTDAELVVWHDGALDRRVPYGGRLPSWAVAADGATFALSVVDTESATRAPMVRIEDVASGDYAELRARFVSDIAVLAFAATTKHLAILARDGRGVLFDRATEATTELRGGPVGLQMARCDARGLLAWGATSTAAWFDRDGTLRLLPEHDLAPGWLARRGDQVLTLTGDATLRTFARHAAMELDLGDGGGRVTSATLVPGGAAVICGEGVLLCGDGPARRLAPGLLAWRALASPRGDQLALLLLRGGVALVETASGEVRELAGAGLAHDAAWLSDGARLVIVGAGRAQVFDRAGREVGACVERDAWFVRVAPHPAGGFVSGTTAGVVRAHGPNGAVLAQLAHHGDQILQLHTCGSRYLSAARDGSAQVGSLDGAFLDTALARPLTLPGHSICTAAALAPDGTWCVLGHADGNVRRWRFASSAPPQSLAAHDGAVRHVALHASGRFASGGEDGHVVTFDASGARALRYPEHGSGIGALEFSPDGSRLLATGTTARLWPTTPDDLAALARRAAAGMDSPQPRR